jgi:hypothetical protein
MLIAAVLLNSCSDDNEGLPKSKKELLTSGRWRTDKALLNGMPDTTTSEIFKNLKIEFFTNGRYTLTNIETSNGNWQFNYDSTQVWMDVGTNKERRLFIKSLANRKFDYYFTENSQRYDIFMVR